MATKTQDSPHARPPRKRRQTQRIVGVLVGQLCGRNEKGQPLVGFPGSPRRLGLPARAIVPWTDVDMGKEVVLQFERGHPRKPVIMGFLTGTDVGTTSKQLPVRASLDGERLVFTAQKEITLQCGQATLTLTRAGKVILRGTYLLSRSSGVNRIKGGSVQIN